MSLSGNDITAILVWQTIIYVGVALGYGWFLRRGRPSPLVRESVDHSKAVHMPLDYLRPERRKLWELPIGEIAHIDSSDVAVDLRGASFIDQDARIYEHTNWHTVEVRRESAGYILTLAKEQQVSFTPRPLYSSSVYLPVIEILIKDSKPTE